MADGYIDLDDTPVNSGAFIYINNTPFPYPDKDSGLQGTYTIVDSARSLDGVMRGERIGRDMAKIELKWSALSPTQWSDMLKIFERFTFDVRYMDMVTNTWKTRKFYVGDRSAQPVMIDPVTNRPAYYTECKANIIDVGE